MEDNVQKIRHACVAANRSIVEEGTIIRDLYLSDILHAITVKWRVRLDAAMAGARPFGKTSQYSSLETEIKGKYWTVTNMWDLTKPTLSSQSDALIRLIASII